MKFKPYKEYREVDLPWLDSVPSHWEVRRIKNIINHRINGFWGEEPKQDKKDCYCIRVADFDMKNYSVNLDKELTIRNIDLENNDKRYLKNGDLLLEKSGGGEKQPVGRVIEFKLDYPAVCSNFISKINIKEEIINGKYLLYFLNDVWNTRNIMPYIKQTTGIQNLDDREYFSNYMQIPSKEEQEKIAKFLDYNLEKIDKFIELTEKQIELLKEQKEVIINNAVTRGIDEDVEMKDSGIEWIGEIPEHWEKDKANRIFKNIGSGTTPSSSDQSYYSKGSVSWINSGDLKEKYIYETKNKITKKAIKDYSTLKIYPIDTIVIAMYGATIGNLSIMKITGCMNQACCALGDYKNRYDTKYGYFSLHASKKHLLEKARGGGQPNISQDIIKQTWLPLPPKKEQEIIVSYIEKKTKKIDDTIEIYTKQIKLIKEYRTSLISSAVTGKVDVRDFKEG